MKVIPFVIHGLGQGKLTDNFVDFNKMYMLSKDDYFTDNDIKLFEV